MRLRISYDEERLKSLPEAHLREEIDHRRTLLAKSIEQERYQPYTQAGDQHRAIIRELRWELERYLLPELLRRL